jgi:orotidine-5'-phosphate decarboxylase
VTLTPQERLIVALDVPSVRDAERLVDQLGDAVLFYKVGYQLAFAGGLALAQELVRSGKHIFLDMKLHDIANTVARGVESIARMGVTFLTVHAYPQTMMAAVQAAAGSPLKLLAVTVLTSYNDADLTESGYAAKVRDLVRQRTAQAREVGLDGIVCAAVDVSALRPIIGPTMVLVTPGIRPSGSASHDQKRTATPIEAIRAGVDYLVVGRPIIAAVDPKLAAQAIVADISQAASI